MLCLQCRRVAARASTGSSIRRLPSTVAARASAPSLSSSISTVAIRQVRTSLRPVTISIAHRHISAPYSTAPAAAAPSPTSSSTTPEKPDYLDEAESQIWDKLVAEFSPSELMVQDVSGGCGSMYGIEITSEKFRGANMLKQQRMVNTVLGEELKGWHGVQLRTKVPA